ncbi:MAG: N-acetyltransferase [Deltaproteobacteria bacterium]|nr:N-acetyltransferase [Deltaproteobacteria bacterium]
MTSLRTARLELRPFSNDDASALWPYVSDPELPKMMSWEAHKDPSETRAFTERMVASRASDTGYGFGIHQDGALLGSIGLHDLVRTSRAWKMHKAELGYWISPKVRNTGLVTEAAREIMRFGFEDLRLHKIVVGCVTENAPSKKVIEKLGFRFLCEHRDHFFRDGRWWNHLSYELTVDEWRAQAKKQAPPVVEVRAATRADLDAMAKMAAELVRMHHAQDAGRFMLPPEVEGGYRWWFGNELERPEAELWVATINGQLAGYAYATREERDWNALLDPHGAIHDIFVDPQHRRAKVGDRLLAAIVGALEQKGAPRIVLSTMVGNLSAQALFRRHNFRPTMLEMTRGG